MFHFTLVFAGQAAEAPHAFTVDAEPFEARMVSVDKQWRITVAGQGRHRVLAAENLVYWGDCRESGRAGGLVLVDGGFFVGDVAALDKESIRVSSGVFGAVELPRQSVAGMILKAPLSTEDADKLRDRVLQEDRLSDRVLLENDDEIAGTIEALRDGTFRLKTDVGPIAIKVERVKAIVFDPTRRGPATQERFRCWAGFSDGSRLLASQMVAEKDSLQMQTVGGSSKTSPKELVFLQPLGGRAVYLSDLKAARYQQTPFFGVPWPYHNDRSVTGGLLRSDGHVYMKGIGVHSHTDLVYAVPKSVSRFKAEIAIDDCTAGRGSVQFRVLVDGRERFASGVVRGGQRPVPVSVDVRGGANIQLVVDYADRADVLDRANWLNARLVR